MAVSVNEKRCPQNHPCPIVRVCPTGAVEQDGNKAPTINAEKCIDCGKCVRYCGYGAFHLK